MKRYDKARADFESLEEIAELDDQMELDAEREPLMRNPTKAFAANMYESAIELWFKEHPDTTDPVALEIGIRRGYLP